MFSDTHLNTVVKKFNLHTKKIGCVEVLLHARFEYANVHICRIQSKQFNMLHYSLFEHLSEIPLCTVHNMPSAEAWKRERERELTRERG